MPIAKDIMTARRTRAQVEDHEEVGLDGVGRDCGGRGGHDGGGIDGGGLVGAGRDVERGGEGDGGENEPTTCARTLSFRPTPWGESCSVCDSDHVHMRIMHSGWTYDEHAYLLASAPVRTSAREVPAFEPSTCRK